MRLFGKKKHSNSRNFDTENSQNSETNTMFFDFFFCAVDLCCSWTTVENK